MENNVFQRSWHVYQNYVRKAVLPADDNQSKTKFYWRNELFCTLLIYIIPLSIIAFVPGVYAAFLNGVPVIGITDIIGFLLLVFITFSRSLTLIWRKAIFIVILYSLASVLLYYASETGIGLLFLLAITIVASIIFPVSVIFYTAYLNTFICLLCTLLIYFNVNTPIASSYTMQTWVAVSTTLILLNFVSAYCLSLLVSSLENYINDILQEQHRSKLLESVITHTKDSVLITEAEPISEPGPRILYVNDAFTKMTGYTAEEVIGKTPRILQGPNSDYQELARLSKSMKNWEPCEITTINYKKNGEEFWINFTVSPVANESGWYTHWIAIERDVTEQKQKELETELLSKISMDFSFENDLMASVNAVCKTMNEFGKFDFTEIWLPNVENNRIQLMGSHAISAYAERFYQLSKEIKSFHYDEGLSGKVWQNNNSILWGDIGKEHDFVRRQAAEEAGIHSALGIPLRLKEKLVGVLVVATQKELEFLAKFETVLLQLEHFIGSEINRKTLENSLQHLYEAVPDILCLSDFNGRFLKMNKAGYELLGYTEEELLYHSFDEFEHPEDKYTSTNVISKLSEVETIVSFENRYLTKVGKVVWLSWTCKSSLEEGLVYATARNITEEKKLRQLNKQTREIAKVGGWEYDLTENNLFWSEEVHLLHETDPNNFVPNVETAINFYKEEHRAYVSELINESITDGVYLDYEAIIITTSKKEHWIRVIGKPEFIEGKCVKFVGIFQDITDKKLAESRLIDLSNNLPGVVFQYLVYPDGTDVLMNVSKGAEKIWGYTPEEVEKDVNLIWDQIKAVGDYDMVKKSIIDSIEKKSDWSILFRVSTPNGERRVLKGVGTPQFMADGSVLFNSVILDITKEIKNEELLDTTTKMARIGSWEVDLIGNKVFWSDVVHEIHETDSKTFFPDPESSAQFYRQDYLSMIQTHFEKCINTGEAFDYEAIIITAKKQERWVRVIGNAEIIEGRCIRLYGSFQDIHEQKMTAILLEKSERQFRTIFEIASLGIAQVDPTNGKILLINSHYESITGYTVDELLNMTFADLTHPDDVENDWALFSKAMIGDAEYKNEKRYVRKDGSITWVRLHVAFIRDEHGKAIRTVAICEDISESKKAKEKLIDSEQEYRMLSRQLHLQNTRLANAQTIAKLGSWELEFPDLKLTWSDETYHIFGIDNPDFVPSKDAFLNFLHPLDIEKVETAFSESLVLPQQEDHSVEHRVIISGGEEKVIEEKWRVVFDDNGAPLLIVGSCQDITSRKQIEEEILKLNNSLEDKVKERTLALQEANKELETFSYTVSHDLQSPLRSISGFSKILLEEYSDKLEGEGKEFLTFIDEGARRMSRLINDLLRFAKLGKAEIVKKEVDMNNLVKIIADDVLLSANGSKTKIVIEHLKPAFADEALIRQVYSNLIGNAVKYSAKKENPIVELGMLSLNGEDVYFVKDNGTGFEMKYADKIFGIFQRLHHHDEFEGTGVGLAIAHSIINRHGGRIWADAEKGVGATFYFTLGKY